MYPLDMWTQLLVPGLEGRYILKRLVLISVALALAGRLGGRTWTRTPQNAEPAED